MDSMSFPPGFRFHPTDEELVFYFLERKITGLSIELEIIPEVDLYKCEPWDLPDKSLLPSKDMEWYFYSPRDRKYPNGSRTNRATRAGYWKATGKDRPVNSQKRSVGMKKTLVYYRGRAPNGIRTNWVMHEYRLIDSSQPGNAFSSLKDSYSLCRVFKKTNQTSELPKEESKTKEAKKESEGPEEDDEKDLNHDHSSDKVLNCDASSSDLTQGTPTQTVVGDDFQALFACDEANSSANSYSLGIMEDPSNLFQDLELHTNESMNDKLALNTPLEHLEMEDLYGKFKDSTYGTLEEIISLCSSQDIRF